MWPIASFPGEKRQSRLAPVPAQTPRAVGAARVPAPRRSTWECTEHSTRRRDAQQRPAKRSSSSASPKPHQSGRSRRARAAPKALRLRAAPQGTQERFRTRGDVIPRRREAPGVGPRRPEALCRGPPRSRSRPSPSARPRPRVRRRPRMALKLSERGAARVARGGLLGRPDAARCRVAGGASWVGRVAGGERAPSRRRGRSSSRTRLCR